MSNLDKYGLSYKDYSFQLWVKRSLSATLMILVFIIGAIGVSHAQNNLINKGTTLKVSSSETLYVIGSSASLTNTSTATIKNNGTIDVAGDITNESSSSIQTDGTISLTGNWTNNATASVALTGGSTGTIEFDGSSSQSLSGNTTFENLTVNNSSGISLSGNQIVNTQITFSSGKITTNTNRIELAESITLSSYSSSKYIVGNIRQNVNTGTYTFPVGTASNYELATLELTSNTGANYFDVSFSVSDQNPPGAITVNGAAIAAYLDYGYWTFAVDGGSILYNVTVQSSGHTNDAGATADKYAVITDIGSGWADIGTHSTATQVVNGGFVSAKRSALNNDGNFIIGRFATDTYTQPTITNECRSKGTYFKMGASTNVYVVGASGANFNNMDNSNLSIASSSTLDVAGAFTNNASTISNTGTIDVTGNWTNESSATLTVNNGGLVDLAAAFSNDATSTAQLDGSINLTGNWTNSNAASLALGGATNKGTVTFDGSSTQTLGGSANTSFENLVIDNTSGVSMISSVSIDVSNQLTFTNGKLTTNSGKVTVSNSSSSAIASYTSSKYIVGTLNRALVAGTYEFPIGSSAEYELATFEITTIDNLTNIELSFTEDNSQTPPGFLTVNGALVNEFLDYGYWVSTPTPSTTNAEFNITVRSDGHSNGGGTPDVYTLISNLGAGWVDQGTHSNATQSFDGDAVIVKRSSVTNFGNFIVGKSVSDNYSQPTITNDLNNSGITLKVGTVDLYVLGSSANLTNDNSAAIKVDNGGTIDVIGNVTNDNSSSIQLDGTFNVGGNWTNNSTGSLALGGATNKGTVSFDNGSSAAQTIGGSSATTFENLTVNNSNGITLAKSPTVSTQLTFTSGLINTSTYFLQMEQSSTVSGNDDSKYVNGKIRQYVTTSTTYTVPVGTATISQTATLLFTNSTGLGYVDVSFTEDNSQTPPGSLTVGGAKIGEFLNYGYWTLTPDVGGSYDFDLTVRSGGHSNGGGTPDKYALVSDIGSGWSDQGTHSPAAQSFDGSFIIAKRTELSNFGNFIVGKSEDDTYSQPTITNNLTNSGTYFKVASGENVYAIGTDATLINNNSATLKVANTGTLDLVGGVTNAASSNIQLDGTLSTAGDWSNAGTASLALTGATNKGTVIFDGSSAQTIGGSVATVFEGFTINNSNGITIQTIDPQVDNQLTFTTGLINTGSQKLILGNAVTVSGNSNTSYVNGTIRQNVTSSITYTDPVGTASFSQTATLLFANSTGLAYVDISFTEDNSQTPPGALTVDGAKISEFLDYGYWTLTPDAAGTYDFDLTVRSGGHSNGGGTPDKYALISDTGSGWSNLGTHSSASQSFDGGHIIAKRTDLTTFGNFIVGKSEDDTYSQPTITNNLTNSGTYFKVSSGENVYALGTDATLINNNSGTLKIANTGTLDLAGGVTNGASSAIEIDGDLKTTGDWSNSGTASLALTGATNKGTVTFDGSSAQTMSGSTVTVFENVILNNSNGVSLQTSNQQIDNTLTFTSGLINTGSQRLIIGQSATITGNSNSSYVNGAIRQNVTTNTTYNIPIGTATVSQTVTLLFANTTGLTYVDVAFTEDNSQAPPGALTVDGAKISEFLDYGFWTLTPDAAGTYDFDLTVRSGGHSNGGGTPDKYALISDTGSGWSNLGTHSSASQSFDGSHIIAKRTDLTTFGNFIVGKSEDDTYSQPTITNNLTNSGTYFKVATSENVYALGTDATLINNNSAILKINPSATLDLAGGVTNGSSSSIQIDGNLNTAGDWANTGTASVALTGASNKGTVTFDGSSTQTLSGNGTTFENFVINNSSGINLSGSNPQIDESLTFTSGKITTGTQRVIMGQAATVSGNDDSKYVVGNIRQNVTTSTTYTIPVGTATVSETATLLMSNTTGLTYVDVSFNESTSQVPPGSLTVDGAKIVEFLNYGYWSILPNSAGTYAFELTFRGGGHSNGGGTPDKYALISDTGSGWSSLGTHSSATQSFDGSHIIAKRTDLTTFGNYIIGKSEDDTYSQPVITNNLTNSGTYFKVAASENVYALGTDATLLNNNSATLKVANSATLDLAGGVTNGASSALELDGSLNTAGDWSNSGTASLVLTGATNKGTVTFDGTSAQNIGGSVGTVFENFVINNANDITLTGSVNQEIDETLTFTSGKIITGSNYLIADNSSVSSITGHSASNYVVGNLRRRVASTGSYDLPVGSSDYYQLGNFNISSSTGLNHINASYTISTETPPGGLTVGAKNINEFLNYGYWTVAAEGGFTAVNYTFTGTGKGHSNGGGNATDYVIITDSGSGWQDLGTHSDGTQSFSGSDIIAARSALTVFGNYIIGKDTDAPVYPLTNELRNKGAVFRVTGSYSVNLSGVSAEFNNSNSATTKIESAATLDIDGDIINASSAVIEIDGNLNVSENFTNNATASLTLTGASNKGTVTFDGTSAQSILGSTGTTFENLVINNSNGITLSGSVNQTVSEVLTLTDGLVTTGTNRMIVSNTSGSAITGHSTTSYIFGNLRQNITTTTTYNLPVGTATEYELAAIELINPSSMTYIDASYTISTESVPGGLTVNGATVDNFHDYGYWNINPDAGTSNFNLTVTGRGHTDLGGGSDRYAVFSNPSGTWIDAGVHSSSTQLYGATEVTAKRSTMSSFGQFIIGYAGGGTYAQPAITNELLNKGSALRIVGAYTINLSGTNGEFNNSNSATTKVETTATLDIDGNMTNGSSSNIELDGSLNISGNLTNNGTASFVLTGAANKGTVTFDGALGQTIDGTSGSTFETLVLNNSSGLTLSGSVNQTVSEALTLTSGKITTGSNILIISNTSSSAITGQSTSNYIVGNLRQYITTATYNLPIGTATEYELASIELTNPAGMTYLDASFTTSSETVPGGLTVNGATVDNFLDYGYWNINPDAGTSNFNLTLTARGHTDLGGTADRYAVFSNPSGTWIDAGIHSSATQTYSPTEVTALRSTLSSFGKFLIGYAGGSTYTQPAITNELLNKGAVVRITGAYNMNVSGISAEYNNNAGATTKIETTATLDIDGNITNASTSDIQLDGSLNIEGNLVNNGTASLVLTGASNKGTVTFDGSSAQSVSGSVGSSFENLVLNNSTGLTLSGSVNQTVSEVLTLTSGIITTGSNILIVSNTSTSAITGQSTSDYIFGNLRRYITTAEYPLPVGTAAEYELATIDLLNPSGMTYLDISYTISAESVPGGLTVNGATVDNFLDYGYWNINPNAGTSNFHLTLTNRGHTDLGGTADRYAVFSNPSGTWVNVGDHSSATQTYSATEVTAVRSNLSGFGKFLIGYAGGSTYTQPTITNELLVKGAVIRVTGANRINVSGTSAEYNNNAGATTKIETTATLDIDGNLTNASTSDIQLDGSLEITGDFTNNGTASLVLTGASNKGTVTLNGTSAQSISGSSGTTFETLVLNNSSGLTLSGSVDQTVSEAFTFTSGKVTTGSNKLIVSNTSASAISGHSTSNYIIGNLRRYVTAATYELPIGTAAYYELASIELSSPSGMAYLDASFTISSETVPTGLTVNGATVDNFLDYGYWNINPDAGTATFNLTVTERGHTDLGGSSDRYAVFSNPAGTWIDAGSHSSATQTYSATAVTAVRSSLSSFGKFLIGYIATSTYTQPTITNELKNKGSIFRIVGANTVNISGASAELNNSDGATTKIETTATLDIEGDMTNATTSNIQLDGSINITGNITNNGTASFELTGASNKGTVTLDGTSAQTIGGSAGTTFENLILNNSNGLTLSGSVDQTVSEVLTMTSGHITTGSNRLIVSNTSASAISGYSASKYIIGNLRRYVTNTSYDLPIGTATYYQLATTNISSNTGLTYFDVSFTEDNSQTPPGGLTVNGQAITTFLDYGYWTINANGGMAAINYNIVVNSDGHSNGGGVVSQYALITDSGSGWQDLGSHVVASFNGSIIVGTRNNMTAVGNFIVGKAADPTELPITNTLLSKGAVFTITGSETVTVSGSDAEVKIDNSGIIQVSNGTNLTTTGDFINENSGAFRIDGTFNIAGDFTNNATASLVMGDGTHIGTVVFNGSVLQAVVGSVTTAFENVTINNDNLGIFVSNDFLVSGLLNMTDGDLDLRGGVINLGSTGSLSGESSTNRIRATSSDVDGMGAGKVCVTRNINNVTSLNVGGLGLYITTSNDMGSVTITRGHQVQSNMGGNQGIQRFYDVTPTNQVAATLRIDYWETELGIHSGTEDELVLYHETGPSTWEALTSTNSTSDNWVRAVATSYSMFGPGGGGAPLPVELLDFDAYYDEFNDAVRLQWETAQELNSDFFTIQRSTDGHNFEGIFDVKAAGFSTQKIEYEAMDEKPLNGIAFYRLKQTDFDGSIQYSDIISVTSVKAPDAREISIYPNPNTTGKDVFIAMKNFELESNPKLTIMDLTGKVIHERKININNDLLQREHIVFEHLLNNGMYIIRIYDNGQVYTKKLIVK